MENIDFDSFFEGKDVKVILANAGSGKALPNGVEIPTKHGFRLFGTIAENDYVIGSNGKETKVIGVYPQGKKKCVRLDFKNGRQEFCSYDHLWTVYTRDYKKEYTACTLSTKEILEHKDLYFFPVLTKPIEFYTEKMLKESDAYLLGCFAQSGTRIKNDEAYFSKLSPDAISNLYTRTGIIFEKSNRNNAVYMRRGMSTHTFFDLYKELNATNANVFNEKVIRRFILNAPVSIREAYIAGILDCSGGVDNGRRLRLTFSNPSFILLLQKVFHTIGISCKYWEIRQVKPVYTLEVIASRFRLLDFVTLQKLRKELDTVYKTYQTQFTKIKESFDMGELDCTCIEVDADDKLFCAADCMLTHNTTRLIKELGEELKTRRPEEIGFVTFTRKGAEEGLRRLCEKYAYTPDELPYVSTIHSLTFKLLGLKRKQIFSFKHQVEFNKKYGYNIRRTDAASNELKRNMDSMYLDFYDLMRSGALTSNQIAENNIDLYYYNCLVHDYETYKKENDLYDFFDCLIRYLDSGEQAPCKVLMVDECLVEGTPVRMKDNSIKFVQNIVVGDKVKTPTGFATVTATCSGFDRKYKVGSLYFCNSKHPIKDRYGNFRSADSFKDECVFVDVIKNDKIIQCETAVKNTKEFAFYYGITIDSEDRLFLLANGAVVHNCQDLTSLQWKVVMAAFRNVEKVFLAGDDSQCQIEGSTVLTRDFGYLPIEDVEGKSLITFDKSNYRYYGHSTKKEYKAELSKRFYKGSVYTIYTTKAENTFTPNHKMLVKMKEHNKMLYITYLTEGNGVFRFGSCQWNYACRGNGAYRIARKKGVDKVWVLKVSDNEAYTRDFAQYLIKHVLNKSSRDTQRVSLSYFSVTEYKNKIRYLLHSLNIHYDYPFATKDKAISQKGNKILEMYVCNAFDTLFLVPCYQGASKVDKKSLWTSYTHIMMQYEGYVYSLNVPKYHTYVTSGGLTVHNCIYKYSGARPDFLIHASKKYPVEHLSVSHRIPKKVYYLANAINSFIQDKTEKKFLPKESSTEGSIQVIPSIDDMMRIIESSYENSRNESWFLLARNRYSLLKYTDVLEEKVIPYETSDGFCIPQGAFARLNDYFNFSLKGYKNAVKKAEFENKFGITDFTLPFTETALFSENRKWVYQSYIDRFSFDELKQMRRKKQQFLVSTIHHVKGGEADNVVILLENSRRVKKNYFEDLDDELRVLYVGVTRTKKNLYFVQSSEGQGYDDVLNVLKSEFDLDWD